MFQLACGRSWQQKLLECELSVLQPHSAEVSRRLPYFHRFVMASRDGVTLFSECSSNCVVNLNIDSAYYYVYCLNFWAAKHWGYWQHICLVFFYVFDLFASIFSVLTLSFLPTVVNKTQPKQSLDDNAWHNAEWDAAATDVDWSHIGYITKIFWGQYTVCSWSSWSFTIIQHHRTGWPPPQAATSKSPPSKHAVNVVGLSHFRLK